MDVEFYRGKESSNEYYQQNVRSSTERYNGRGGSDHSNGSVGRPESLNFYYGSKQSENLMNGNINGKHGKMADNNSRDVATAKDSESVASYDSTGKKKSFRRLITRFAEKTSMQGVPYINSAKFWWAKLIWSVMLLAALAVMSLHLWYLIDQYISWPKQTRISLGFETLKFPEVTICNTNVLHKGRFDEFDGASELKELVEDLRPENLVPDQFDPDYDPHANPQESNSPSENNPPQNNDVPTENNPPKENNPPQNNDVPMENNPPKVNNPPKENNLPPENDANNQGPGNSPSPSGNMPPSKRRKRFVNQYENLNKTRYGPNGEKRPNPRDVKEQKDDDFDGKVDAQTALDDLFRGLYMDITKKERAMLGHNITDMLVSCTFNGRECAPNMFTLHQTSKYGNCWSIRSDKFKVKSPGPSGGLTLVLFLEVDEYLKGLTTGYGARVHVHEPGTYPYPAEEGLYIPASMETDIGLRMIVIERLGGYYGNCDNGQSFARNYGHKFTRRECQSFCRVLKIMKTCNCFDDAAEEFAEQEKNGFRPCRSLKEVECMVGVQEQFESQELTCDCENPCNEIQYLKAVSQRQWPTEEYAMVLLEGICDKDKDVCAKLRENIDEPEKIRGNSLITNNFVKLNIYYEDLNYENITEAPEIELQQFLSDVGGAIGLWIGLSILSLCEVIQLLVELFDYGIHKTIKSSRAERRKRKRERKRRGIVNDGFTAKDESQWPNTEYGSAHKNKRNGQLQSGFDRNHAFQQFGSEAMNERQYVEGYNNHHYSSLKH